MRFCYIAEEFIRGNKQDPLNPFYFEKVIINAIRAPNFNPSLLWVFKYNSMTKQVAADVKAYVDNLRALECTMEQSWAISHQIALRQQYLGIQDAPQKRRIEEGPWAGTVYKTPNTEVSVIVTQDKWDKGKGYLNAIV